jgi:geranylgeranyl reductase family protein
LIIGAGPAGSAAARTLASRGLRVVLADKSAFPRDKVCGDALIPDALKALERLGLKRRVLAEAEEADAIRVHAPNGSHVELASQLACLPRARLDEIVRCAAVEAGATSLTPYCLVDAIVEDGFVQGAVLRRGRESPLRIRAQATILATGAASRPLERFGVCERHGASAIAARLYVRVSQALARKYRHLSISYDRQISPGYGWVFPGPGGVFNIGVGYFQDDKLRPPVQNMRQLMARFVQTFPPAAALVAGSRTLTDLRGAPLRTNLCGARLSRPGLVVIGEAAGMTYAFSGEGIGKAIESGIIAGEVLAESLRTRADSPDAAGRRYATCIVAAFAQRFRAYDAAQHWLARPALANFLARRANAGRYVRAQLQALLDESGDPRELFSATGLVKALVL